MKQARTQITRDAILNAAEILFVDHGYDGTSIRQITGSANVNISAINYHFGSKEALVQAVLKRRLEWLNKERLKVLDELESKANGAPLKPSQIVDAFFGTILRHATDNQYDNYIFLRLLERTMTDPSAFIRTLFAKEYAEVMMRYKTALLKALPNVPEAEILWRFHFMLGATSYAIVGTNILQEMLESSSIHHSTKPNYDKDLLPRLLSFLIGGLRAPLPETSLIQTTENQPSNL